MRRAVVVLVLAGALLSGCELVADFDRSKIPTPDAGPADDGGDTPIEDAATPVDAGAPDSAIDAGDDEDAGT